MPESKNTHHDDDKPSAPSVSTVLLLFGTLADTTWRLFVPTIGGTVLGIWGDKTFDTKPWLIVSGVVLGAIVSFGLVYLQLRKVRS